jgi:sugar fermentation stimulation protein A
MKIIYKYNNLEIAEVINRPSKKIKSPYLADINIKNKEELAHTPGLGLCGFITKESIVAVSEAEGERKSKYTIELVKIKNDDNKNVWVGANPATSNLYFNNMIEKNLLSFIPKVSMIKREFKFQKYESRFDFYVETENNKKYIIEIKNVPLVDYPKDKMPSFRKFPERKTKNRNAIFPDGYQSKKGDCVSPRALKHLRELVKIKKDNSKIIPMLVFIIQREDCYGFTPNFEKDPLYSNELKKAYELGLTVKAVMLKMSPKNVKYVKEVPVIL